MSYSATKTEGAYLDDLIVGEWDQRFSRKEITLTNNLAVTTTFYPGEIIESDSPTAGSDTDITNAGDWILAERVTLAAAASQKVAVIYQGPIIINEDALTVQAAATRATVLTDLKSNLSNVVYVTEPTISQTGPLQP